jgi:exonuclease SbcC
VPLLQDNLKSELIGSWKKAELLAQFDVLNMHSTQAPWQICFNASGFVNYVSSIYLQNLAMSMSVFTV